MYTPKYTISNQILRNIATIEASREVIENAPLVPAYERRFRQDALVRSVHHGTHIEGNDLTFTQAEQILDHFKDETSAESALAQSGIVARERDVQEVINYRNVMDYLEDQYQKHQKGKDSKFTYNEEQIKQIHRLTTYRIIPEPNQGIYRNTQVVLRDSRTGEVTFRPPPAVEVPYLMEDFVKWLASDPGRQDHPVLRAGCAHYSIAAIHPFVEGNGRTARAFATLILYLEEFDIRRLFSIEEYFDSDAESYYNALISTSNQARELEERDLTKWLEYFTYGLAIELGKVKERVKKLSLDSRVKMKRGEQVMLSERQIKIVEYLSENTKARMAQLRELFSHYSEDTVLRDLQALSKKSIIRKRGKTKGAFYELVT